MQVLVIGSEGFIGQHLCRFLLAEGFEVSGADIVAMMRDDYYQINPVEPDYAKIFASRKFDFCINASGQANVRQSFDQPKLDYDSNTVTVFRLLDAIRLSSPACKFLQLSSAAVYGNTTEKILKEDFPLLPFSPYGYHKLMAELVCREFFNFYKIPTCSMRLFSVYGEGQAKLLLWDMWQKYHRNSKMVELFGSGEERRDYIYVRDLMHAIHTIMLNHPFDGEAINVANGSGLSVREVAGSFFKILDEQTELRFSQQSKSGDPNSLVADVSVLRSYGYEPKFSMELGLSNYIKWLTGKK